MGFKELPPAQRLAILAGIPVLITAVLGYLTYQALQKLGPDRQLKKYFPLVVEKTKKRNSAYERINGLKEQIRAEQVVAATLEPKREELAKLQGAIQHLQAQFPSKQEVSEMRQTIGRLLKEARKPLRDIDFINIVYNSSRGAGGRGGGDGSAWSEDVWRITLKADFNTLIYFINRVENNPRFMAVRSFTIAPGSISLDQTQKQLEPQYGKHNITIEIVTYVYRGDEA